MVHFEVSRSVELAWICLFQSLNNHDTKSGVEGITRPINSHGGRSTVDGDGTSTTYNLAFVKVFSPNRS